MKRVKYVCQLSALRTGNRQQRLIKVSRDLKITVCLDLFFLFSFDMVRTIINYCRVTIGD